VLDVESPSCKTFHAIKNDLLMARKTHGRHRYTRYVLGKIGGDGIHYNSESGEAWAKPVNATIDQILAADIAVRRKLASNR
jgi:hypothetical protein